TPQNGSVAHFPPFFNQNIALPPAFPALRHSWARPGRVDGRRQLLYTWQELKKLLEAQDENTVPHKLRRQGGDGKIRGESRAHFLRGRARVPLRLLRAGRAERKDGRPGRTLTAARPGPP